MMDLKWFMYVCRNTVVFFPFSYILYVNVFHCNRLLTNASTHLTNCRTFSIALSMLNTKATPKWVSVFCPLPINVGHQCIFLSTLLALTVVICTHSCTCTPILLSLVFWALVLFLTLVIVISNVVEKELVQESFFWIVTRELSFILECIA